MWDSLGVTEKLGFVLFQLLLYGLGTGTGYFLGAVVKPWWQERHNLDLGVDELLERRKNKRWLK